MKLQCLIKSRYPGAYNRTLDFGVHGVVEVIEGVADVGPELASVMVAGGNFIRIEEFEGLASPKKAGRKPRFAALEEPAAAPGDAAVLPVGEDAP